MDFDDDATLDTSQIDDRRGSSPSARRSAGGGAATAAGGAAVYKMAGGGVVGLIVLVAFVVISGALGGGGGAPTAPVAGSTTGTQNLAATCRTGADADTKPECRIVAAVNSVQAYWTSALASTKTPYRPAKTVFFTDAVSTGCGSATSDAGPFYCPTDQTVYLDLGFFDQLRRDFGAQGERSPRPT